MALQTILVLAIGGPTVRKQFMESKRKFLLLSSFAILPDLDTLFRVHRTVTHSFFFPLVLASIAGVLASQEAARRLNLHVYSMLASFSWLVHILLDIGWGPMAIFWPLDEKMYDIEPGAVVDFAGWWIFPFLILGFFFRTEIFSSTRGAGVFIINLDIEERKAALGGNLVQDLSVDDLITHVLLFLIYVVLFLAAGSYRLTAISVHKESSMKASPKFVLWLKKYQLRRWRRAAPAAVFAFVLVLSLVNYGGSWSEELAAYTDLEYSQDAFKPFACVIFGIDDRTTLNTTIRVSGNGQNMTMMWGLMNDTSYQSLVTDSNNIETEAKQANWSYEATFEAYLVMVQTCGFIDNDTISVNGTIGITITSAWEDATDGTDRATVLLLTVWDENGSEPALAASIQLHATVTRSNQRFLLVVLIVEPLLGVLTILPLLPDKWIAHVDFTKRNMETIGADAKQSSVQNEKMQEQSIHDP